MRFVAANYTEMPERALALQQRAVAELLPPLLALLERRRLAGTLLYGKCAPHEVEFRRQFLIALGECDASKLAPFAQFIGYGTYLMGARLGLFWLFKAGRDPSSVVQPTAVQTQQIVSCAATALDLVSAPRPVKNWGFNYEAELLYQARLLTDTTHISPEHRDALKAALDRLMYSAVIEERGIERAVQNAARLSQQKMAKVKAEKEAPGRKLCAHCGAREVHVAQFKRCSACKTVVFCCKDCQLANWPAHKTACKAARKAAASGAPST